MHSSSSKKNIKIEIIEALSIKSQQRRMLT